MLGTIADHADHLLTAVRDDEMTLNAAYEAACEARDAERQTQFGTATEWVAGPWWRWSGHRF